MHMHYENRVIRNKIHRTKNKVLIIIFLQLIHMVITLPNAYNELMGSIR